MTLIPAFIRSRLEHRPNLLKILDNIGWLFFDKILRMGVGLFVGVWIARYLGPEQFGLLSFALAFTGLFGAIATMGLKGIVVRDIVRSPDVARVTLGTAAVLHLIGGLIAFLLILGAIAYIRSDDVVARSIVAILGSMMLLKFSDIAVYWFESQVQSKYTVWVQNCVFLVFAAIKVVLILQQGSLIAFVWAMLAEAAMVPMILLMVMSKHGPSFVQLRVSLGRVRSLLKDSWPLILSAIAVTTYMKIDQIMLGQMIGNEAVGIYSAAVRISEVWYFIPMAIVASVFPTILETQKKSEVQYYARLQKLYDVMVAISIAVALPMTFFATPIVGLLFGETYFPAGDILAIHIWGGLFVSMGVARSNWLLAENLQHMSFRYVSIGAIVNVLGNIILIPNYGPFGAACTTVLSQLMVAIVAPAFYPSTRLSSKMFIRSLNPIQWICRVRSISGR